tara:strand:- start:81 stop:248 length:168 start_codon:yes stop_codon:yes gene_type:complete
MAYPTNPIYKETKDIDGDVNGVMTPGYSIPNDPENTHWQEYLAWKAAGNTPEAAD